MPEHSGTLLSEIFQRQHRSHGIVLHPSTTEHRDCPSMSTPLRFAAMPPRAYRYIGPPEIMQRSKRGSDSAYITNMADAFRWAAAFLPAGCTRGSVPATFIIDTDAHLWIADRHSEHVACADGKDVLAAGEMFFEIVGGNIHVAEITNQSTGYCPEPNCWEIVAQVLDQVGLLRPTGFTAVFLFRRCNACGATNLIKDDWFECDVCGAPLSHEWNDAAPV